MSGFLTALDQEMADLERQLAEHPAFRKLNELRRVRAVYAGDPKNDAKPVYAEQPFRARSRPPATGKRAEVLAATLSFLRAQGKPTKTGEILEHLKSLGIEVPGTPPANTISSLLSKSEDAKSHGWAYGWTIIDQNATGDANKPDEGASPVIVERQDDFLSEPAAQGREAGPGGGT